MYNQSNVPLFVYLAAIPLISTGTTTDRPGFTWIGFLALPSASFIMPALRIRGNVKEEVPETEYDKAGGKTK